MRVVIRKVPGVQFQGLGMMKLNNAYVAAPVVPTYQAASSQVYTTPTSSVRNINTASAPTITPPVPVIPTVSSNPSADMDPVRQLPTVTPQLIDSTLASESPNPKIVPTAEEDALADIVTSETVGGSASLAPYCRPCEAAAAGNPKWSLWYLAAGGVGLLGGLAAANYFATKKA